MLPVQRDDDDMKVICSKRIRKVVRLLFCMRSRLVIILFDENARPHIVS